MTRPEQPSKRDLERAIEAQCHFAKRVMITDPRHADFHKEINHLLDEWQVEVYRNRGLTLFHPTW